MTTKNAAVRKMSSLGICYLKYIILTLERFHEETVNNEKQILEGPLTALRKSLLIEENLKNG